MPSEPATSPSVSAGHHHAHIDAALDGLAQRVDGFGLGDEVGVLNPDAFFGDADHRVVKDLHSRGRVFGLGVGRVNRHLARWDECPETPRRPKTARQFARPSSR